MKKSDSTRTLEENVFVSQTSLSDNNQRTNKTDDSIDQQKSEDIVEHPQTVKTKYRFSSVFKSFRSKKSKSDLSKSSMQSAEDGQLVKSESKDSLKTLPKLDKKKSKSSILVKKLSLTGKKNKKTDKAKSAELLSSTTDIKRHTPEGATLSLSEISLVDIDYDDQITSKSEIVTSRPTVITKKGDQLQITISGKKIDKRDEKSIIELQSKKDKQVEKIDQPKRQFSVTSTVIHSVPSTEPNKPQRKIKKINISESCTDNCPATPPPAIPYNISESEITNILNKEKSHKISHTANKGAIKKTSTASSITTTKNHKTREEFFETKTVSMNKSGSLERGRRYPRPFDEFRKFESTSASAVTAGNNLNNSNLSGSISDIVHDTAAADSENMELLPKIEFEVGTKVRPPSLPLSSVSSAPILHSTPMHLSRNSSVDTTTREDFSSLDTSKSSESSEPRSEGSRRRIAYVAIQTPSFDQVEPIIEDDSSDMYQEPISHLSGISEYSLDSDFSISPYFDLVMDDVTTMASSSPEKREHLYKILVIGELGTGKTSFIKRYVHQFFSQNYRATIGVDFALKVLNWDQNTIIRLQLWDIAGQERFGNMTRVYYKEAVGAFIVFDVTRSATFDAVIKWKQDLDSKVQLPNGSSIPCILLANKCDQQKQGIINTPAKMDEYVREHGFAGWYETSAKENVNIEEASKALVNKILLNDKLINTNDINDTDKFGLDANSHPTKKNCSC